MDEGRIKALALLVLCTGLAFGLACAGLSLLDVTFDSFPKVEAAR